MEGEGALATTPAETGDTRNECNRLLGILPGCEYALVMAHASKHAYDIGDVLIEADREPDAIYFPIDLIGSVIAHVEDGIVEAATVGREGFVGLPALLGWPSITTTIVQVPGSAWRLEVEDFRELLRNAPELGRLLLRYTQTVMDEAAQTAACNRAHPLEERCAKWLLLIHDRVGSERFQVTHKYLATMLGVRRAGVTVAAGTLQKAGIIRYSRGKVTVLDRDALERVACECYPRIRDNRSRLVQA